MDQAYYLGVPEIDAQHEEINELVSRFTEAIAKMDQRHLLHQSLKRLHQLLVTHFDYEESLMSMVGYAETLKHKKVHQGILKILDDFFDHPPPLGDYEYYGRMISEKLTGHIATHDVPMIELIKQHVPTLRDAAK